MNLSGSSISNHPDGTGNDLFGQRFDAAGAKVGGEFTVNTTTESSQSDQAIAAAADGSLIAVWTGESFSEPLDGDKEGIFGIRLGPDGTPPAFVDLDGGSGDDSLTGDGADNTLAGSDGDDTLTGAGGSDTACFCDDSTGVVVDLVAGSAVGSGSGTDVLIGIENAVGGTGDDTIDGDGLVNTLDGDSGNDHLAGGDDNDRQFGGTGSDLLEGNAGADILEGGADDDTVSGGLGNDVLSGNDGTDVFVFAAATGSDVDRIRDFAVGSDGLRLLGGLTITGTTESDLNFDGTDDTTLTLSSGDQIELIGVNGIVDTDGLLE